MIPGIAVVVLVVVVVVLVVVVVVLVVVVVAGKGLEPVLRGHRDVDVAGKAWGIGHAACVDPLGFDLPPLRLHVVGLLLVQSEQPPHGARSLRGHGAGVSGLILALSVARGLLPAGVESAFAIGALHATKALPGTLPALAGIGPPLSFEGALAVPLVSILAFSVHLRVFQRTLAEDVSGLPAVEAQGTPLALGRSMAPLSAKVARPLKGP